MPSPLQQPLPEQAPLILDRPHSRHIARELKKSIPEQTGDARAYSHIQLYKIYRALSDRSVLLRVWYERSASKHLEEAVVWAKYWPEPRSLLASLELGRGDFWKGREDLSKAITLQRAWIQNAEGDKDKFRLDLCNHLTLAGLTELQIGKLEAAREAFTSAMEELELLSPAAKSQRKKLEESIIPLIFDCLFLEHRYAETLAFIDSRTAEDPTLTSSDKSQSFRVSKDTLNAIITITGKGQPPTGAAELWANLIDEVQRAETADALQKVKSEILTTVKIGDISQGIQTFASAIETLLKQQDNKVKVLEERLSQRVPAPVPAPSDLSAIVDPEWRATLERTEKATRALMERSNRDAAEIRSTLRRLYSSLRQSTQGNIAVVRKMAASTYKLPLKYRAYWIALNAGRFIIQIAAVGYFLEKVVSEFLEQKGRSAVEILALKHTEFIIACVILIGGFIIGKVTERKLDQWFVPKYKNLLIRIVINQFNNLLFKYGQLERLLNDVRKAMTEAKIPDTTPVS